MNQFFLFTTFLFLTLNRFFSKLVSIGPIYTAEIYILISLLGRIKEVRKLFLSSYLYPIFFIVFIGFLFYDILTVGLGEHSLRRFAVFIYFLIPFLFLSYLNTFQRYSKFLILGVPIFGLMIVIISPTGFQPTIFAEVMAAILFISLITPKYRQITPIALVIFLITVSGYFSEQSLYRTPIIVFAFMLTVHFLLKEKNKFSIPKAILALFLVFPILIFSGILGNLVVGISGLFGADSLYELGLFLGGQEMTTRGTSAGTTETRAFFWSSIIIHATSDIKTFLMGSGFHYGFLEVTLPYFDFVDKELIEPHNVFMGVFFKTGLIGLVLVILFLFKMFQAINIDNKLSTTLPLFLGAVLYISMEVSLENPHGAIAFWFIVFSSKIFKVNH